MNNRAAAKKNKVIKLPFIERLTFLPYLIILIFSIIAYFQTLDYGYVNLDDDELIVQHHESIGNINKIDDAFLTSPYYQQISPYYRPILTVSFIFDAQTGGTNPFIYHLTNLILHCIVCCCIYYLIVLLSLNKLYALFSSIIFSVHPLFTNAVAWIVARNDLLLALFFLLSFIFFIKYYQANININAPMTSSGLWLKRAYILLHFFFFFLAVFSKETALISPIVFLLYFFLLGRKSVNTITSNTENRFSVTKPLKGWLFICIVGWSLIILIFLFLREHATKNVLTNINLSFYNFILNLPQIPEYIAKFYFPYKLSVLPIFDSQIITIGIIFIIIIITLIIIQRKNILSEQSLFGLSWFLLFIIPAMLSKVKSGNELWFDYLECRAYLPSIGILNLLVSVIPESWAMSRKKAIIGFASLFVVLLMYLTLGQIRNYKDAISFYNSAIASNPQSLPLYLNRGNLRINAGDYNGAMADFNRVIIGKPNEASAYNSRAKLKIDIGDFSGAINDLQKAIHYKPDYAEAYNNLGNLRKERGDLAGAIESYDSAIKITPNFQIANVNRGIAKYYQGKFNDAIRDYNVAIRLNRKDAAAYYFRGLAKNNLDEFNNAISDYDIALRLKTDYMDAFVARANSKLYLDDYKGAIADYTTAINLSPDNPTAYYNRGIAELYLKIMNNACDDWRKAQGMGHPEAKKMIEKYCILSFD